MKKMKLCLYVIVINMLTLSLAGCWNYKEIEKLAIVSGVAIDRDGDNKLLVTTEVVSVKQEQRQSSLQPVYMQAVGSSFFDTARSLIAYQGKRLYWSHAKVVIVSEKIAKEGISKVLDFMSRDTEIREDMWILVAKGGKACDIFNAKPEIESILSFQLDNTLRAQKSISRYPSVELYDFIDKLAYSHNSAV
ncbi:MAG: Ger(x)C family spore germination protein, partial [Pseudomonadota bacterium]